MTDREEDTKGCEDLGEDERHSVDELECEGGDEVVLDEVLLLGGGQHHVHVALLLEEDEPVED
jgi:hypothetical protein